MERKDAIRRVYEAIRRAYEKGRGAPNLEEFRGFAEEGEHIQRDGLEEYWQTEMDYGDWSEILAYGERSGDLAYEDNGPLTIAVAHAAWEAGLRGDPCPDPEEE